MKIALVIQNADRRQGGAEAYTLDLARWLTGRGHQVTVVAEHGPAAVAEGARAAGFQVMYLGSRGATRWGRLQDFLQRLRDLYENRAYDVVHAMLPVWRCDVYQPHSGLAADLLVNGHMKHPGGAAQQFSQLFNRVNPKRRGLAQIERDMMSPPPLSPSPPAVADNSPWLLCFSSVMRDFARAYFPLGRTAAGGAQGRAPERLVMLMNGIDLAKFDPAVGAKAREAIRGEWKMEPDQRLGLLVGNNWKLKGVREAIEALKLAEDRRLVLMVAGRDAPAAYQKQARRLGVADRVIFAGSVTDTRPLYGAADFVVLPTRRDTCSLVVLEALAMGLPVITTRQNGASDVIEDGRQGVLLERGDAPGLAAAAMRAMIDDRRRREMAREALAMRETLSIEHHVSKIEAIYRQVIAEHSKHLERTAEGVQNGR